MLKTGSIARKPADHFRCHIKLGMALCSDMILAACASWYYPLKMRDRGEKRDLRGEERRLSVPCEYSFEVTLRAVVRVSAENEAEASKVVPSVLGAPGSLEIELANHANAAIGGTCSKVTNVEFRQQTRPKRVATKVLNERIAE
jgi:hypothetical protein